MEQDANSEFGGPAEPHEVALVSIAISLKRIADALSYQPGNENLYDFINDPRHNTMPTAR
jgi:hypothetical protein